MNFGWNICDIQFDEYLSEFFPCHSLPYPTPYNEFLTSHITCLNPNLFKCYLEDRRDPTYRSSWKYIGDLQEGKPHGLGLASNCNNTEESHFFLKGYWLEGNFRYGLSVSKFNSEHIQHEYSWYFRDDESYPNSSCYLAISMGDFHESTDNFMFTGKEGEL